MLHTPDGISDEVASTLPVAGLAATATLAAIGLQPRDAVLIGAAGGGGVGMFAFQLAQLVGARVIGTYSPDTCALLRQVGVEPAQYGPGLADRVRALAPNGLSAATDLFGTETVEEALDRITAGLDLHDHPDPNCPGGVRATGGIEAGPDALARITGAISAVRLVVPIAATLPIEQTGRRDAPGRTPPSTPRS